MPPGIPFIIGNEAAERFSFYGMKTILVVFMTKYLHYMVDGESGTAMSDAAAREYYHYFVTATYFFPVFGSVLGQTLTPNFSFNDAINQEHNRGTAQCHRARMATGQ